MVKHNKILVFLSLAILFSISFWNNTPVFNDSSEVNYTLNSKSWEDLSRTIGLIISNEGECDILKIIIKEDKEEISFILGPFSFEEMQNISPSALEVVEHSLLNGDNGSVLDMLNGRWVHISKPDLFAFINKI